MDKDVFKITARGLITGALAAEKSAGDYFNALAIYKDYVKSYKDAHHVFGIPQVSVCLAARRDNNDFEIWDVMQADIC